MSWFKIFALTTAILFAFGMVMIDGAVAGEKIKWHGWSYRKNFSTLKVASC